MYVTGKEKATAIRRASGSASLERKPTGTILVRDSPLLRRDSNDFVTVERHSCNGHQTYQIFLHCGHIAIRRWLNAMGAVERRYYLERNYKNYEKTKGCSALEVKRPQIVGNRNPYSAFHILSSLSLRLFFLFFF